MTRRLFQVCLMCVGVSIALPVDTAFATSVVLLPTSIVTFDTPLGEFGVRDGFGEETVLIAAGHWYWVPIAPARLGWTALAVGATIVVVTGALAARSRSDAPRTRLVSAPP